MGLNASMLATASGKIARSTISWIKASGWTLSWHFSMESWPCLCQLSASASWLTCWRRLSRMRALSIIYKRERTTMNSRKICMRRSEMKSWSNFSRRHTLINWLTCLATGMCFGGCFQCIGSRHRSWRSNESWTSTISADTNKNIEYNLLLMII